MAHKDPINPARWPALVGGGLVNVALGTYYAWSVYVPALEKEFGWTRTQTSLVATIDMVMLASSFLVAGMLQNRIGPRAVATIGGLLFSAGLFLASYTQSLTTLYLTWGVMVGIGLGFGYLAPITVGSKWFPNHRGLVNGLAIGIFAAGSGVFGPVGSRLVESIGWRATFQTLRRALFRLHDGRRLPAERSAGRVCGASQPLESRQPAEGAPHRGADLEVLRMPRFYLLWFAYALGTTAGTMVISQLVPFAQASGFSAAKRGVRDHHRRDRQRVRAIPLRLDVRSFRPAVHAARHDRHVDGGDAVALRVSAKRRLLFYALLFFVYYCYGTQLSVYTALAGDFYGTKYLATNYGVLLSPGDLPACSVRSSALACSSAPAPISTRSSDRPPGARGVGAAQHRASAGIGQTGSDRGPGPRDRAKTRHILDECLQLGG